MPILKQIGGSGHKIANFAEGEGDEKFAKIRIQLVTFVVVFNRLIKKI